MNGEKSIAPRNMSIINMKPNVVLILLSLPRYIPIAITVTINDKNISRDIIE